MFPYVKSHAAPNSQTNANIHQLTKCEIASDLSNNALFVSDSRTS